MAGVTTPEFAGEGLVVCGNPDLAIERARQRKELLAAIERGRTRIQAALGAATGRSAGPPTSRLPSAR
ncbi:MAG: hypothetical protein ACREFJ_18420 [Acetobacteraceae bacterium]